MPPSTSTPIPAAAPRFDPALSSLDDLLPHEGVLTPAELEELARDVALRADLWEPLVRADRSRRRYELLFEDDRLDAWVLSWMPGQATGFHDHDVCGVGLAVARGHVREDWMRYAGGHVEWRLGPGDSRAGGPGYVHRVQHAEGEPAVTIHVYSPRLDWVGQYRVDDEGIVRREVQPGRRELTAQVLAEGTLGSALERF
ncbi:MAG TPA: cysteine dioxygenase family protein [Gaiellaceae bacterium]|nr:cysteine dioxygenase family protein [Gaiellaceae bacterium]